MLLLVLAGMGSRPVRPSPKSTSQRARSTTHTRSPGPENERSGTTVHEYAVPSASVIVTCTLFSMGRSRLRLGLIGESERVATLPGKGSQLAVDGVCVRFHWWCAI